MTPLRGIAWNHTRGFVSAVASAQRYEELHPEVTIVWEKRSLQAFADASLADLAAAYDLIIMDHPHTALAATEGLLLPYEEWLPADFLADQATHSVGGSHESYRFQNQQWTLATDAAAPIATWRPDLIQRYGLSLPETWQDVLEMARLGFVNVSAFPIDILMDSYMFCAALGGDPFTAGDAIAPDEALADALAELGKLIPLCDPACLERNPIRTAEWMSQTDDPRAAYCPFAYGYSNYSRPRYAKHPLKAGGLVTYEGRRLRSTLGGAGVAVSSRGKNPQAAMDFARFMASPDVQKGVYFDSGGQPGHRTAWLDAAVNAATHHYFTDTLQTLDEALLRPQFPGYMSFQDAATPVAHDCIAGNTKPTEAARRLNQLYRASLIHSHE
jgi:multiple sugar transport system substrate-binding protein